jgi:hypothetical protein
MRLPHHLPNHRGHRGGRRRLALAAVAALMRFQRLRQAPWQACPTSTSRRRPPPLDQIPRKYPTIAPIPARYLKLALTTLEPISFGTHTLEGFLKPGKKSLPKQEMLNLVEFVADIKPETQIQPHPPKEQVSPGLAHRREQQEE